MSTGTIPVVRPEPQTPGEARRTAELEASQSLARRYGELAHAFEPRPVDAVLRGFDVVIAGLILVVLSPLIAVLALAVLLTSGRPVLYQGARVGRAAGPSTCTSCARCVPTQRPGWVPIRRPSSTGAPWTR